MKTKSIIGIGLIVLCVTSFWLGRLSGSKGVITYSANGCPTSFNRAWPTYGLPITEYTSILTMLRNGHSKEAIPYVDGCLEMAVYDAECRRPLLQGQDLETLDKVLVKAAHYREQFPRPIDESTNGFGNSYQQQQYVDWIAKQKEIDAFLHDFAKQ